MRDLYVNTEIICKLCKQPIIQLLDGEPRAGVSVEEMVIAVVCRYCDGVVNYATNQRPEGPKA